MAMADARLWRSVTLGVCLLGSARLSQAPGAEVDRLVGLLKDNDAQVRAEAAASLGKLGDKQATEPLIAALKDADLRVRQAVSEALGKLGDGRAVPALLTSLRRSPEDVSRRDHFPPGHPWRKDWDAYLATVAQSLATLGTKAPAPLRAALRDADADVRETAGKALKKLRWKPASEADNAYYLLALGEWAQTAQMGIVAVEPIVAAAREPTLTRKAAATLMQIGAEAFDATAALLKHKDPEMRASAAAILAGLGDRRAVGPLIATLKDSNLRVRTAGASALRELPWTPRTPPEKAWYFVVRHEWTKAVQVGPAAIEPLVLAIQNVGPEEREPPAEALIKLGDKRAIKSLTPLVKSSDPSLRLAAVEIIGGLGGPDAVAPLLDALADERDYVRLSAAEGLGNTGDKRAVAALVKALKNEEYALADAAALALAKLGDGRGAPRLARLAASERASSYEGQPATEALAKLGRAAVGPLIEVLSGDDALARRAAVRELARIGDGRAVPPLIDLLRTREDLSWPGEIVAALGTLGDRRALPILVEQLTGTKSLAAAAAAEALTKIGKQGISHVVDALTHRDAQVRNWAALALKRIDWHPPTVQQKARYLVGLGKWDEAASLGADAVEPLIQAMAVWSRDDATATLVKIGRPAVGPLIAALKQDDEGMKISAVHALGRIKDKRAIAPLRELLTHKSSYVREAAKEALANLGPANLDSYAAALKDPDPGVRLKAVKALGEMPDAAAARLLTQALKDKDRPVRRLAIYGIQKHPDRRAVRPLIEILNSEEVHHLGEIVGEALAQIGAAAFEPLVKTLTAGDEYARMHAASALGEMGDKRAIPHLVKAMSDPDEMVRSWARSSLRTDLDWTPANDTERAAAAIAGSDWDAALSLGKAAIEPAVAMLKSDGYPDRVRAIRLLAKLGDKRAVPPLTAALKDPTDKVRVAAARALYWVGDQRAVEGLVAALEDKNKNVGFAAARTLGRIGDGRAVEPLAKQLRHRHRPLQIQAAQALGDIGNPRAVPFLTESLKGNNRALQQVAAEALARVRDQPADLPAGPKDEVQTQSDALVKLGPAGVDQAVAMLKNPDRLKRRAAARALGRLGDLRGAEPLCELGDDFRQDPTVRSEAIRALGDLGYRKHSWRFIRMLDEDGAPQVQAATAYALGKLGDKEACEDLMDEALKHDSPAVRAEAALALGALDDRRALNPLLATLSGDEEREVRAAAAEGLGRLGDKRAVPPLIAALDDRFVEMAAAAAGALGVLGDARAVEPLIKQLGHRLGPVRAAAASALGKLADRRAIGPLQAALKDRRAVVRKAAAAALGELKSASG